MSNNILFTIIFLAGVFISAISQVILKTSANKSHSSFIKEYINPRVILAYTFFFGASLLAVTAYRHIPLSLGVVLESTGYIYIPLMSYFFLKERITFKKAVGMIVIIIGIFVFSYSF